MNRSLILYDNTNSSRLNIYSLHCHEGNYNPPDQVTCPGVIEDGYYVFRITDNKLEGCNNFGLIITLPEIKGIGRIRYQTNFVYKLINEFEVQVVDTETYTVLKKSGMELLFEFRKLGGEYDKIIGNNLDLSTFKEGFTPDDIIFKSQELYFPIVTIFDNVNINPHTCLRLLPKTKLQIRIKFDDFKNVLIYDKVFLKNSLPKISNIDLQPHISFMGYNTSGSEIKNRFIEELELVSDSCSNYCNKKNYYTPEFPSITNVIWYTLVDNFLGNTFVSYPDFPETEQRFIDSFITKIVKDLLIIDDNINFLAKRGFSKQCKFKEIQPFETIVFDINKKCIINIKNIPENKRLYYHTNIITFSRRNKQDIYNISNKFSYILGQYLQEEDRIHFIDIKHDITIEDVSIPNYIWSAQENTAYGDLRSEKSKETDVVVYDKFVFGTDFISKNLGIFTVSLKTNSNVTIHDINRDKPNYEFYFNSNSLYPICQMTDHVYPSIFVHRFNLHNKLFCEPSRLIADNDTNFRCLQLSINWKEYPDTDPKSLYKKNFVIGITKVKRIVYNDTIYVHYLDDTNNK